MERILEAYAPGSSCMPDLPSGGLNTKLHVIVDGLWNPVEFMLSAGKDHDSIYTIELLEKIEISGSNELADRAYGAKAI